MWITSSTHNKLLQKWCKYDMFPNKLFLVKSNNLHVLVLALRISKHLLNKNMIELFISSFALTTEKYT